jgi:hypothetical protein
MTTEPIAIEALAGGTAGVGDDRFRSELKVVLNRCVRLSTKRALLISCHDVVIRVTPATTQQEIDDFVRHAAPAYVHVTNLGSRAEPDSLRWVRLRFGFTRRLLHAVVGLLCSALPAWEMKNRLYRLIGLSIGKNVEISQGAFIDTFAPRLISIGDDVVIGAFAKIFTHVYRGHGRMFFGPVIIGRDCVIAGLSTVGPCVIEPNVTLLPNVITIPFLRRIKAGSIIGFDQRPQDVRFALRDFPQ